MKHSLVIVESPTKAKTIRNFLDKSYTILASFGHVRDLPSSAAEIPAAFKKEKWARLGVNVEKNFEPLYVIPDKKKKVVQELKNALKDADQVYIATDEDREGESIGWHLVDVLKPKVPIKRMVFHEITKEAIEAALENTRTIDANLVDAQETRRILDRLVGYTLSPLLWRKIAPKLSAGRVQSVAVRLLVMRERERMKFVMSSYYGIEVDLAKEQSVFKASLQKLNGQTLATSQHFDPDTGKLKGDYLILDQKRGEELVQDLEKAVYTVEDVKEKKEERHPAAPFTTSTLQQEANRKLRLSARDTMRTAQSLYERGLITYMRTDSTNLSTEAVEAARNKIVQKYGKEYLNPETRTFATKVKNAQEAHEAIRPAGKKMSSGDELGLSGIEGALYDLIWKRTVACQMKTAQMKFTTVMIRAIYEKTDAQFSASGKQILFPGFLMAYTEGSDDPQAMLDDQEHFMPALKIGDRTEHKKTTLSPHQTQPPARYTEASLVKKLETEGIGRPSTYASIIDTITDRGYVRKAGNQLIPTFIAFAVTQLLEQNFSQLVDLGFTASMETLLDDIASGQVKEKSYLAKFYSGKDGLETTVQTTGEGIDPKAVSTITNPKWDPYLVRVGRYGPYAQDSSLPENPDVKTPSISLSDEIAVADLTKEEIELSAQYKDRSHESMGTHPETGKPMYLKKGPYGFYLQLGENDEEKLKRVSLPKGESPESITVERAIELLQLPKTIGVHPETGKPILVNIGKFGPYVQHDRTYASVKELDELLNMTLPEALEKIAAKAQKSAPYRELGILPGEKDMIDIRKGRFGYYVAKGRSFATIPKDMDLDTLTIEQAVELLEKKNPSKKKAVKSTVKKKAPVKKTVKKVAVKKK